MKRMLLVGMFAVGAWALSCPAAWADPANGGAQRIVRAPNAAMTVKRPFDYTDGRHYPTRHFTPAAPREPAIWCRARSSFGADPSRTIETVYVAQMGSVCGMPPFYGFGFAYPVNL